MLPFLIGCFPMSRANQIGSSSPRRLLTEKICNVGKFIHGSLSLSPFPAHSKNEKFSDGPRREVKLVPTKSSRAHGYRVNCGHNVEVRLYTYRYDFSLFSPF